MSGMDRFDWLPDSVLCYILAYLPIKEAVRAQLISKRWRNLCAYLPVLHFDFADFLSEDMFSYVNRSTRIDEHSECHENFVRIVDDVLASRQIQQIDRFKLVWPYQAKSYCYHQHPVRRWIPLILKQSPRVLSIYVQPCDVIVDVPDTVFTSLSLEEMKLHIDSTSWPEVLNPASINLPILKKLNLGYCNIKSDFMNNLILGCPNLEELELYVCRLKLSQISCNKLKRLIIDGSYNAMDIRVSIPSLQYLKVTSVSCQTAGIIFENMSSLEKACVCFLTVDKLLGTAFYQSDTTLNGLSGVTYLDILLHGSEAEDMLHHALSNSPDFENLKVVHVESFDRCLDDCMNTIDDLVEYSPTLQDLTFCHCENGSNESILLKELGMVGVEHENCRLVECKQRHIYDSVENLEKWLHSYMMCFEKMKRELSVEEDENDEEDEEEEEMAVAIEEEEEEEEEEGEEDEAGSTDEEEDDEDE